MTKQHRWVCSQCGTSVLASSKPRKNDIRRYCFPCSEKSGFLVSRTCLFLEAVKKEKKEQKKIKIKSKKNKIQKEKIKKLIQNKTSNFFHNLSSYIICDQNVQDIAQNMWKTLHQLEKVSITSFPTVDVKKGFRITGNAWSKSGKIRIRVKENMDAAPFLDVLLHELCHVAAYRIRPDIKRGHSPYFRSLLSSAARELWKISAVADYKKVYGTDANIISELRKLNLGEIKCCYNSQIFV